MLLVTKASSVKVFIAGNAVLKNRSFTKERTTASALALATYFLHVFSEYIEDSIVEAGDVNRLEVSDMIEDTL